MPRSVFDAMSLSAFIYFLAQVNLRSEILLSRDLKSEIHRACVAEQQRHLTVNQADASFVGASPTTCTNSQQGCRLTGKPSVSKIEVLSSNLSVPAKSWKGSLTGKAVVPKTTARMSLAGSSPVPSANFWTCSSVESERDSAKVEVVRSNRTRSTIYEPVVQLESEQSSSKRQAAGSSPAGFTNTGVAQLG